MDVLASSASDVSAAESPVRSAGSTISLVVLDFRVGALTIGGFLFDQ
jgi:hypothetical protein